MLEVAMRYRNDMLAQPQDLDYNTQTGATDIQHIDNIFCGYMGTLVLETDK